jgi:hypothetical protein
MIKNKTIYLIFVFGLIFLSLFQWIGILSAQGEKQVSTQEEVNIDENFSPKILEKPKDLQDLIEAQHEENDHVSKDPKYLFDLAYQQENAYLLKGGLRTKKWDHRHWLMLSHTINLEKWGLSNLGSLFIQNLFVLEDTQVNQDHPLIGDLHVYSNILGENRIQFFEFLWKHRFRPKFGTLNVELGRIDGNAHFAVSKHEHSFLSGSSGYSPAIAFQSYPEVGWGTQIFYDLNWDQIELELAIGIFDGSNTDKRGISTGKQFWMSPGYFQGNSLFMVSQNTLSWSTYYAGNLSLGLWHHTGDFQPIDHGPIAHGTSGFYFTGDQSVIKWKHTELNLGIQMAFADQNALQTPRHLSFAWLIKDLWEGLENDEFGMSISQLKVNGLDEEYLIEHLFRVGVFEFLNVAMVYTYVKNPAGVIIENAHLGIVRFEVEKEIVNIDGKFN